MTMVLNTFKLRTVALALSGACLVGVPADAAPSRGSAVGVAPLPTGATRPTRQVLLSIGEGEMINLPASVANVWTSNPDVADVYVNSPRQINLYGKAFGEATIFATSASGAVVYSATVRVSQNISSVDQVLKVAMPDADIRVTNVGQVAVLTGTVAAPDDAAQAEFLVKSLLNPGVKVSANEPLKVAVLSRLRTATPLQVNLQVRIAEVSRSFARDIGVNLSTVDSSSGFKFGLGQLNRSFSPQYTPNGPLGTFTKGPDGATLVNPTSLGTTLAGAGKLFGLDILGALDLGEQVGLVATLSNPNLTALSGETADFLAGGEYPIPISQGLGTTSVEYKKYGVSLAYTPTVLANGRISLRVRPEVSEISTQNSVTVGGVSVPSLTIRRAETTVELGSGQSFMIAGLLSNNSLDNLKRAPGLGEVPVLGNLFKSTSFRKGETELVIIVTPYLVNPVNANDIKLPTDGFNPADEAQKILGNQLNGRGFRDRPKPTSAIDPTHAGETPRVGLIGAPAPTPPATAMRAEERGSRNSRKTAEVQVRPGFSLN